MEDKTNNKENLERIKSVLKELNPHLLKEDIVRNNSIEFELNGELYRVRMPKNKEKNDADRYKHKTYLALLKSDEFVLRSELIKILKEKQNVDIDVLDNQIAEINDQINHLYEKLATIASENEADIAKLKGKIEKRFVDIQKISIEKATHLSFCIEEEVYARYLEYLAIKCAEKFVEQTGQEPAWEPVWKTQEEYDDDINIGLTDQAILYLSRLFETMRRF